jgi:hypothetical protein
MKEKELKQILQKDYNFEKNWKSIFSLLFKKANYFSTPSNPFFEETKVKAGKQIGAIKLDDNKQLAIFEVEVDDSIRIDQNRKGLRDIAAKHIDQNITHGALVFFYSKNQKDYRFSFIAKWSDIDLETGEFTKGETKPKRYTYLLGGNESCTTPAKRILELAEKKEKDEKITIQMLKETFSVEPLKKDFFKSYKEHYEKFWRYIANPEFGYRDILLDKSKEDEAKQEKPIRDFAKKLLGRIVFLHFLQKKGWMGCQPNSEKWEDGEKQFLQLLFQNFENKDKFNSQCLTKLFFNTLNRKRKNDLFEIEGLKGSLNGSRVPYLNGGLFDTDKPEETLTIDFPASYFESLLEFFAQYNFTIDENSPDDHEVGIDPEMLGHIFENLLEENREKGAFYTPKEVVQYMCKESTIQYLKNHFPEEAEVESFIRNNVVSKYFTERDNAISLNQKMDAVKVCDPAIGSGAFPIGILHEIFEAKKFIYPYLKTNKEFNPAKVKKNIIQNSIYGVDIEKGAVDIAQLRFWLALVVDETKPQPLPNLDYKIMQGNSLLESYEGIDLSKLGEKEDEIIVSEQEQFTLLGEGFEPINQQLTIFDSVTKEEILTLIKKYFDPDKWEKETSQKIDKAKIKRQITDIVEGKIHAHIFQEKQKIKRLIRDKEKLWNISSEDDLKKLKQKTKEFKKFLEWENRYNRFDEIEKNLIELQKTEEKPYFLWHLYFMDVFENGGFDIVIGNPPYIQLQRDSGILANLYSQKGFETFERTGDIYALFYEKGVEVLKNAGHLTFITSNKWMRANYGKSLRKFLIKENPIKLLDLGAGIFEHATVDTNILVIEKTENAPQNIRAITISGKQKIVQLQENDYSILNSLDEKSWVILSPEEQKIKEQIEQVGTPLKDWNIEINYGIKTGLNEAFIIDSNKKEELIATDPKSAEIIKPVLRGRDIKKYKTEFADLWLINSHNGVRDYNYHGNNEDKKWKIKPIGIENYPAIKKHLNKYWDKLVKRQDKGFTPYNLRNCAYLEDFGKEKIIYQEIVQDSSFAFDNEGKFFCNDTSRIITGKNLKYIISNLNSRLFFYAVKTFYGGGGLGNTGIRMKHTFFDKYSLVETHLLEYFEILVDYILFLKNPTNINLSEKVDNEHIALFFEDVIDGCVFELYFEQHMQERNINILDLVTEEIKPIEDKNEKVKTEIILNTWLKMRKSEIAERMRLFTVKSPDILKIIKES